MNAISIVGVVAAFGLVFLCLIALCAEKEFHPFRRVRQGCRLLPAWEKALLSIFVGVWIAFASVKDGTNGVDQVEGDTNTVTQIEGNTNDWTNVEGTNAVGQADGEGTNGMGWGSGPLMTGLLGRTNLALGAPLSITDDDVAQMWRIDRTTDTTAFAEPTANAVTNANWRDYGGMSDSLRIRPEEWHFPYGDKTTTGLTVFENGDFRPNVKTHFFPQPFDANLSLLPRWNWGLLPDGGESVFWHEHTPSNSLVLTWHNALYNRDVSCPTNFQVELFADGRFDYRYPDRTVQHVPVFPFDWDGDGLENSVDPEPLVAGPDAHGATAEWYSMVCSNIFTKVEQPDSQPVVLPTGESVYFRPGVNTNAYFFVDVVAQHGPVLINFTADGPSNLGNPVVVAQAGENNRVPLLIGVQYVISSSTALSIVAPPEVVVNQLGDQGRYSVEWPAGLSYSLVDGVATPIVVEAGRLNGEFLWSGGCCTLQSGQGISFQCHHCGCGGCQVDMDYLYEGYVLARPGPSCGCTGNDVPTENIPYVETASGASLELGFDKSAVIFENAYDNTPTNHVPLRSTEVVLKLRANGGIHGGTLVIATSKLSRLAIVSGSKPANESIVLAPYQVYEVVSTNRGALASTSLKDIEVRAELRENDGGDVARVHTALTSFELKLEALFVAPSNPHCNTRHVYGVGEKVRLKIRPQSDSVTISTVLQDVGDDSGTYETFDASFANGVHGVIEVNGSRDHDYICPISKNYPPPIKIRAGGVEYDPQMVLEEPSEIITTGASWGENKYLSDTLDYRKCWPPGALGFATLVTTNYVGPMHVSFRGIGVSEIPCNDPYLVTGCFLYAPTARQTHTTLAGAGWVHNIQDGNFWFVDGTKTGNYYMGPTSSGINIWKIPIGWHRISRNYPNPGDKYRLLSDFDYESQDDRNSRPLRIGNSDDAYTQNWYIDQDGTCTVAKFGYWISRSRQCRVVMGQIGSEGTVLQTTHHGDGNEE